MNRIAGFAMLLILLLAVAPVTGHADSSAPAVPDAFMRQLAAGINGHGLAALRSIIHPDTLKCMTTQNEDYYAWWLWKDGSKRYRVTEPYQTHLGDPIDVKSFNTGVPADKMMLRWPVQPDYGLHIHYHSAAMSVIERLFEISLKDGKASLVMDCPTALGLEAFHAARAADALQIRKLERVLRAMSPADRQALTLMAKQGMKLDGIDAAEQKYHLNTTEALALMDMIEYADTP